MGRPRQRRAARRLINHPAHVIHDWKGSWMSHPHPELGRPPELPAHGLRVIPLGGLGEVGRNMAVLEHRGELLIIDCGVLFPDETQPGVDLILPDFDPIRDRLDDIEAVVLTHGHEDHIGAVPYLLRERPDIPLVGSKLTLALLEAKLREHRQTRAPKSRWSRATGSRFGSFDLSSSRSTTRSPTRWRSRADRGRRGAAHRRLQDGPAAAGRPDHRPARVRPARRGGRRPLPGRLHERRGPGLHHHRAGDRARC